ncbi:MAG: hypothetical protein P1V51_09745 [Deltaproteobacteria bacterium]|nr:hypothetical protein [Deltaproteobacteria bacterium]
MAKAIIQGKEHEVRCDLIIPKNYGVAVLSQEEVPTATVNLGVRKAALHRYKINAKDPEAALRRALELMKASGEIDDYVLEPHEEAPPPPPPKAKPEPKAKPAPKAAEAPAAEAKPEAPSEGETPRADG